MKEIKRDYIIILLFFLSIFAYGQNITLELDNPYISLDEWTNLTVRVTGDIKQLRYTEPDGVSLTSFGQSTSYSFVNGKNSKTQSISFRVKPLKEGAITMPVFYGDDSKGVKFTSEEIKLYVDKGNNKIGNSYNNKENVEKENVKLYINLPEREIYVGESVPVEVVVYFLNKYPPERKRDPYVKSGSYTLELGKNIVDSNPQAILGGESYHMVAWNGSLTPLKSGSSELELQMESYIKIPDGGSGFFATYRTEEVVTKSEKKTITVLPLPTEGQPEDFTGAIGNFKINSSINMNEFSVGDPVTLSMDIVGTGNFQRIGVPQITENLDNWKLYPESSQFQGTSFKGVKKFQQILAPLTDEITTLPPFTFSYFNPEKKQYITLKTDGFPITINPGIKTEKRVSVSFEESFKPGRTILLHRSSKPVNNFLPITKTYIFKIVIPLVFLLTALSALLLIIVTIRSRNSKTESAMIKKYTKIITVLEDEKNYKAAILTYKEMITKQESLKSDINPRSITSEDLKHNSAFHNILKKVEDMNYLNSDINETEYYELTEKLIEEIV